MNEISVEELIKNDNWENDEKVNLHFTSNSNIESIRKEGLQPDIGKNSQHSGKERYPRVYFCKGLIPALEEFNHCIVIYKKILLYLNKKEEFNNKKDRTVQRYEHLYNDLKEQGCNIPQVQELGKYSEEELEELAYKIIYNDFKNMSYLKLNLKGCKKEEYNSNPEKYKDVDYFEDEINDEMDTPVEHRNMQTLDFHGVSTDKIQLVKGNVIEIISSMYSKYEEIFPDRPLCEKVAGMEYNEKNMLPNLLKYIEEQEKNKTFSESLKGMVNSNPDIINKKETKKENPELEEYSL